MSRQSKNRRKHLIAKQVTQAHKQGKKIPFTKKRSTASKGKCMMVLVQNVHVRRSVSNSKQGA